MKRYTVHGIKQGHSLIEFLVYLVITVLLIACAMHMIATVRLSTAREHKRCDSFVVLCAAQDVLLRDIMQASSSADCWKRCLPNNYIWSIGTSDVSWYVNKGVLLRSQGIFNSRTQTWTERATSRIADHVTALTLTITSTLVTCSIQSDSASHLVLQGALRNGALS